jgi:uroporphyrinogen-III synthase
LLASLEPDLKLLHLCGEDRREASEARQAITPVTVYRSNAVDSPDLSATPNCVALIHSPRAGRRFAELVPDKSTITIAAISGAAADAVGEGWRLVALAGEPSDNALLALVARLCNNSPPE